MARIHAHVLLMYDVRCTTNTVYRIGLDNYAYPAIDLDLVILNLVTVGTGLRYCDRAGRSDEQGPSRVGTGQRNPLSKK